MGSLSIWATEDLLLFCENVVGHEALVPETGVQRRDLHCNVLADGGSVDAALNLEVDENADLAARVDVGNGGVLVEALEAADLQVFADGHDLLGKDLGDLELGAGVLALHQSGNISGVVLQDDLADILDELDERSGLRAEVGLAS